MKVKFVIPVAFLLGSNIAVADAINDMFFEYKQNSVSNTSELVGESLWGKQFKDKKTDQLRSCSTCHNTDLKKAGKHIKTGKVIEPMALSVNNARFSKVKKIKKWFKRNCKWTVGRECSAQEQADILIYLINQ